MKLEFLLEDLNAGAEPSDADLQRFLDEHPERFALPARISFQQVYLNPDRHPDLDAATSALAQALHSSAAAADLGDRIMLGHAFESVTPQEIARLFGEGFAQAVTALEPGGWIGPVDSGLGRHYGRPHPAQLELPSHWQPVAEPTVRQLPDCALHRQIVSLNGAAFDGSQIRFPGLEATITHVFVRVSRLDSRSGAVRPASPFATLG